MKIKTLPLYVTARACPAAAMFAIALTVERRFGAQVYGEFSTIFSLALSAAALFFGWIVQAISRFSNGSEDLLTTMPQAFWVSWIAGTSAVVITSLVTALFTQYHALVFLIGIIVCCQGLHLLAIAIHQARFRGSSYLGLEALRSACICFGSIGGGLLQTNRLVGLVIGLAAGMLIDATFALLSIRNYRLSDTPRSENVIEKTKQIFSYGWPISIWLSLSLAIPFIDRSVLRWLGDGVLMGGYAYQYDIVFRSFTFILLPITISSQPAIFKAFAEGSLESVSSLLRKAILTQISLGVTFSIALYGLIFYILPLENIVLKIEPPVFAILCISALFWQMALVCHKLLECEKKILLMVKIFALSYFIAGLCTAAFLFKLFGVPGFAFGSAIGAAVYCVVVFGAGKKNNTEYTRQLFRGMK